MKTEEEVKQEVQEMYSSEKGKRIKMVYLAALVVFLILIFSFAFMKTEFSIEVIKNEYPQRLELQDDADAQNTAYSMQLFFDESSSILDEISFDFP